MEELSRTIEQKRELLRRDTLFRPAVNYSEGMAEDEKGRYINYLVELHQEDELEKKAMRMVMEEMMEKLSALEAALRRNESLEKELSVLQRQYRQLDRRNKTLEARLEDANEQLYGRKSRKCKRKPKGGAGGQDQRDGIGGEDQEREPDREEEKEGFDGTESTLSTRSVDGTPDAVKPGPAKIRDLSNRPEHYKRTGVQGESRVYLSDKNKVPGRIIETRMVKVYSLEMCLKESSYELVHYVQKGKKPCWAYFPKEGNPQEVTKVEGTKATAEFMQALAYEVYVKNVTFGKLHQWLTDMGMTISGNTLRNWLKKGKVYLDQLIPVLKEAALEKDSIVNCDETWCKVRKYDHYKKCYIWVLVNKAEGVVIFFYEDGSRGRDVLVDFLGDAELKSVMTDGYIAYVFLGNELKSAEAGKPHMKDVLHQVCMAHLLAKLQRASTKAKDKAADPFIETIRMFYHFEEIYDKEGLTPEERGRRRQGLETKELLIRLRSLLQVEMEKDAMAHSEYLTEALNYLHRFWDNLTAFTKDGNLPIDNNLAERAIRPLTTQRKNIIHFGSDEGAKMAAVYHSIIGTVKLQGKSAWEYLGKFFVKVVEGCRDFASLTPKNIGLQLSNS